MKTSPWVRSVPTSRQTSLCIHSPSSSPSVFSRHRCINTCRAQRSPAGLTGHRQSNTAAPHPTQSICPALACAPIHDPPRLGTLSGSSAAVCTVAAAPEPPSPALPQLTPLPALRYENNAALRKVEAATLFTPLVFRQAPPSGARIGWSEAGHEPVVMQEAELGEHIVTPEGVTEERHCFCCCCRADVSVVPTPHP
ncbi:hypothetical protein AOLI_G00152910 [Acnodon oligacanthus]